MLHRDAICKDYRRVRTETRARARYALSLMDTGDRASVAGMEIAVAHALARFGLGRRGAEPPPTDAYAWLLEQLRAPDPTRLTVTPSTGEGLTALREDWADHPPPDRSRGRALYRRDAILQLGNALTTTAPFRERLVWFWTNHFTISLRRGACASLAGAFVEEAIRPHVTGRFAGMLLAVMRHPAMLLYLDNAGSVGPDSPTGQRTHRGLNENLARECLELHTVSPAAGYTQGDVTNFAKVLTGWSVDLKGDPPGFRFRPFAHEPGEQVVMGRRLPPGEEGGLAALTLLANHPSTHRFLAGKLACHFIADTPSEDAVRPIEAVLRDTNGDLGAAAAALVALETAWQPRTKLRTPLDFAIATLRALDMTPPLLDHPWLIGALAGLGQPPWNAPQPNGWPDTSEAWAAPEAMMRRIDWSFTLAGRAPDADPEAVADNALGPLLEPPTREAIHHAASRRDALTLLFSSPDFQRR